MIKKEKHNTVVREGFAMVGKLGSHLLTVSCVTLQNDMGVVFMGTDRSDQPSLAS